MSTSYSFGEYWLQWYIRVDKKTDYSEEDATVQLNLARESTTATRFEFKIFSCPDKPGRFVVMGRSKTE